MPIDDITLLIEDEMDTAVKYLRSEFAGIRTGRASSGLVDHLKVEYYGSPTDLRQLASIATPEANLIVIKPFDPTGIKDIEKAIKASDLGINPMMDGKVIRLSVPPLSIERRQQLIGQLKKMAEACRVTIRNARRDGNKAADKEQKASEMTEDECKNCKELIQDLIKKYEAMINEALAAKTVEIQET
ncbi:MAG: ribosome recycling factor [Phycisphaerales bacterium]|jgi:ribosome recycling factor|nr:ribosome recycling factor [Phycisphaerales bacterium]